MYEAADMSMKYPGFEVEKQYKLTISTFLGEEKLKAESNHGSETLSSNTGVDKQDLWDSNSGVNQYSSDDEN